MNLLGYRDRLRHSLDRALGSTAGDHYKPVRILREILGTANDLAGRPICSEEELARRQERRGGHAPGEGGPTRDVAPVAVYTDGQDQRSLRKVQELLEARDITYQLLDVADDESTRSWAITAARSHEFPLVFVAGEPIGGLHELTEADVNGQLVRRVRG